MKKYFIAFSLIFTSLLVTWSLEGFRDKFFVFIGILSGLSMLVLFFWWLYKTKYYLLSSFIALIFVVTWFLAGVFINRELEIGVWIGGITFRTFVFWSFYEFILIVGLYLFFRGIVKLFKR